MSRDNFPAELRYNFSVEESHNALPSWWVLFFSVEGNFLGSFIDKLKTPVTITRLVILLERVQYSVTLSPQESSFFVQWIVSWSISDMHCMFYIFNQITKKSVLINFCKYLYLFSFKLVEYSYDGEERIVPVTTQNWFIRVWPTYNSKVKTQETSK